MTIPAETVERIFEATREYAEQNAEVIFPHVEIFGIYETPEKDGLAFVTCKCGHGTLDLVIDNDTDSISIGTFGPEAPLVGLVTRLKTQFGVNVGIKQRDYSHGNSRLIIPEFPQIPNPAQEDMFEYLGVGKPTS